MKVIDSIVDLPLRKFIEVVCKGNLAALILEGLPEAEENGAVLEQAWLKITQEYSDSINNEEYLLFLNVLRKVSLLNMRFKTVMTLLDMLSAFPFHVVESLDAEDLQEMRVEIGHITAEVNKILAAAMKFDVNNREQFQEDLRRGYSMAKRFLITYEIENAKLQELQARTDGGAGHTPEYFQSMLITLGDFKNIVLTDEITVYAYCDRIRRFNEHQKYLSQQANKK